MLSDRIFMGKERTGERFIDDGYFLGSSGVLFADGAAAYQASSDGLKVIRADTHPSHPVLRRVLGRTALDLNAVVPAVIVLRAVHGITDAANAGDLLQAVT